MTQVLEIPVSRVRRFKGQPRVHFDKVALQELADSIGAVGQIVPAVVRKVDDKDPEHDYELIDGERRWRACQLASLKTLKAVVDTGDPKEQFKKSVAANFGRAEHTPLEIAAAITVLRKDGLTTTEVAAVFGKSQNWCSRYEKLNRLHASVALMLDPGAPDDKQLNVSQAIQISELPQNMQLPVAKEAAKKGMGVFEIARFVRQRAKEKGVKLPSRDIAPNADSRVLMTFLNRTQRELERFTDMTRERLTLMLAGQITQSRQAIVEKVESISGDFGMLADAIGDVSRKIENQKLRKRA
jgi:ParB family chromosome partitioning protein